MNDWQDRGPAGHDVDAPHRLRAVVASYRSALQAYTLAVSPAELMALGAVPANIAQVSDPRAQAHLARLRCEVQASGIALPGAIVLAVSGGSLHCECDHLYTLQLQPCRGDRLIVMEGYERLLALAHGERRQFKTLVTAVMWRTALDSTAQASLADAGHFAEADDAAAAMAAAATQSCAARWANATRVWH
ncbi:hypothetical protein [Cupriavidus consociatus]|uniref:hypothetical protein n=1 Tax=Cupriavidus consociatus TaxID=2821357 RepID=UPI001AE3B879|nr:MULTISPECIES: hypothetical protein [unclassified Cupriavidus]MBP0623493.1 hypothetical protein [Cupriavidus sp. LEh25]MDK2660194.1 hypothetical protein [Cupriavidus sp. LEh21]